MSVSSSSTAGASHPPAPLSQEDPPSPRLQRVLAAGTPVPVPLIRSDCRLPAGPLAPPRPPALFVSSSSSSTPGTSGSWLAPQCLCLSLDQICRLPQSPSLLPGLRLCLSALPVAAHQDTVVALQALTKYAAITYSDHGTVTVSVTTAKGFSVDFTVNNVNRLLLQQKPLTQIPGEYSALASGQGCAYVQITLRFNIPPVANMTTFKLSVETVPSTCRHQNPGLLDLSINVRYTGSRNVSNMAIIEVQMLSGYSPGDDIHAQVLKQFLVRRVEIQLNSVFIYLDEVRRADQKYRLTVKQEVQVRNIKPASVKVYDYYQPEENAVVDYQAPCP